MMQNNPDISDEFLNAFVDNQLDGAEKSQAFDAIEQNDALKERVCELRGLKEQLRHAYERPPVLVKEIKRKRRYDAYPLQALAACLLLCIGGASGWFANAWSGMGEESKLSSLLQTVQRNNAVSEPQRFVVHVSSSNPVRLKTALDATENLLESQQQSRKNLQVEIVANAGGLDLLRTDASPYAQRVRQLQEKYPNLDLVACGQTIKKLEAKGVHVKLLPHTGVATSALDQIALRLKQDWSYIKV